MTPRIEFAILGSDLDCNNFDLLNVGDLTPPPNLLEEGDPALSDPRPMLPGSVVNDSVAATAAITQGKLNLNGTIPTAWLGNTATKAAQGNLSERISHKGALSGYASLDANGKIPATQVTATGNPGTVNTVFLSVVPEMVVTGNPVNSGSGTLNVAWNNAPARSWLGVYGYQAGPSLVPTFLVLPVPQQLVSNLDASKFTTGIFSIDVLPEAAGVGPNHASGVVPDPEENGADQDYLGRDMEWHHFDGDVSYQPVVPDVNLILTNLTVVTAIEPLAGASLFYRVNGGSYTETVSPATIHVVSGDFVEAYSSKTGYNNSAVATYVVPLAG